MARSDAATDWTMPESGTVTLGVTFSKGNPPQSLGPNPTFLAAHTSMYRSSSSRS
jgi:hypothetical protein